MGWALGENEPMATPNDFSLQGLRQAGFSLPRPLKTVERTDVLGPRGAADVQGVYVVTHEPCPLPRFLEPDHPRRSTFTTVDEMATRWIAAATVLYIGKAPFRKADDVTGKRDGLWQRIKEYRGFIYRARTNHAGGEDLRRLPDRDEFRVCWKQVADPGLEERQMISGFRQAHGGMRPFGNRQDH